MPAGDGTGPLGYGPMTGRGAGYCAGFAAPGYVNPMPGRGWFGFGRGRGGGGFHRGGGRGWRNWFCADFYKNQLEDIKKRTDILEKAQHETDQ
ncbi:hypothetical protein A2Y85_03345 [candidate division WOR-3 bacterium RBG_13_43_14]|uniref:Uncharacterized protein n=1 Tax=candidate division WOR-3 bacterium RBG_13_43_14 TaxID=1802590 RepID=A0A1F4UA89_UNCW3|nr:MAG: hypothetical protein A2Y85_03345 [candidate division WOR-3 bacterium RBG_13_43_14]